MAKLQSPPKESEKSYSGAHPATSMASSSVFNDQIEVDEESSSND